MGERIRRHRTALGLTQQEVADQLGVTKSAVSMYESDKNEPSGSTLVALARLLCVTTDYLLGITDVEHRDIAREPSAEYATTGIEAEAIFRADPSLLFKLYREADEAGLTFSDYVTKILNGEITRRR